MNQSSSQPPNASALTKPTTLAPDLPLSTQQPLPRFKGQSTLCWTLDAQGQPYFKQLTATSMKGEERFRDVERLNYVAGVLKDLASKHDTDGPLIRLIEQDFMKAPAIDAYRDRIRFQWMDVATFQSTKGNPLAEWMATPTTDGRKEKYFTDEEVEMLRSSGLCLRYAPDRLSEESYSFEYNKATDHQTQARLGSLVRLADERLMETLKGIEVDTLSDEERVDQYTRTVSEHEHICSQLRMIDGSSPALNARIVSRRGIASRETPTTGSLPYTVPSSSTEGLSGKALPGKEQRMDPAFSPSTTSPTQARSYVEGSGGNAGNRGRPPPYQPPIASYAAGAVLHTTPGHVHRPEDPFGDPGDGCSHSEDVGTADPFGTP